MAIVAAHKNSWPVSSDLRDGDELDDVMASLSNVVPRTTRESPTLATTMRSPCLTMDSAEQPLYTASKRRLRRSLSYIAAHAAT
ncbi:hypothetical protein Zm00014a_043332 [Zea mays]|uniref:Uncharacterized protein n=1 Tax=Zea mays TaxID=4577 RepID=A0A3L6DA03_MAIZE|nr:hypothetical protein Zm00014a_043332 [Zea mays]